MKDARSLRVTESRRNPDHALWNPDVPTPDVLIPAIKPATRQGGGKKSRRSFLDFLFGGINENTCGRKVKN